MRSFDEKLHLYAQLAIQEGVGLAPGQELLVFAEIDQAPLVHLVVAEAYRKGAKNVEVMWRDTNVSRIRLMQGSDEAVGYVPTWLTDGMTKAHAQGAARLGIISADPSALADVPPQRVATSSKAYGQATQELSAIVSGFQINWCLIGAASPEWAARVFPNESSDHATEMLWEKVFLASRVLEEDPIAAWTSHSKGLEERVQKLDALPLDALYFKGPGTDLRVGLATNHVWAGGRGKAKNGIICSPNIPTEEVFTMPHRSRVDGVVSSSKALSLRGQLVDGIRVEFKDGVAVSAKAEVGEEAFTRLLDTDEGARRLGEVALVPHSAKVSQTNTLFLNTLFDENAASHIAMGKCYSENMAGYDDLTEEQLLDRGANDSLVHVDWMIGSDQVDVDGLLLDGSSVPLMRSGEWV